MRAMVMDPATTDDRVSDEAAFINGHRWGCGLLLVVSFVAFLSWALSNPLVWVFALVVGLLFASEGLIRKGGLEPIRMWVQAFVQDRLRPKPKRFASFAFPVAPRIPGKWIVAGLAVGLFVGGLAWAYGEGRSHERAHWEAVEAERQIKAAQDQRDLDRVAQSLAQRTVQAEREASEQLVLAVESIQPRPAPRRVVIVQAPLTPPHDLMTPVTLDLPDAASYPDPAPVLAVALPRLLDDFGGLQPPAGNHAAG
jgi:hypothetical protein